MAQSIEEIKAGLTAPTHKNVNGVDIELSDEEAQAILQKWAEAAHEIEVDKEQNGYKEARLEAYPSYGEQLDYIYHNGLEAWKTDIIQPIKEAHPKPDSA
jgi:hypothetical protein